MIILNAMIVLIVYIVTHVKDVITQYIVIIVLIVSKLTLVLIVITAKTVLDVLINHTNSI